MHHDSAYSSLEAAELAKEPEPCQHTLMPVRFVDEGMVKACPCRGHDCEVDGIDAAYEQFTSEWSESVYSKRPKPATPPKAYDDNNSTLAALGPIGILFLGGVLIGFVLSLAAR